MEQLGEFVAGNISAILVFILDLNVRRKLVLRALRVLRVLSSELRVRYGSHHRIMFLLITIPGPSAANDLFSVSADFLSNLSDISISIKTL